MCVEHTIHTMETNAIHFNESGKLIIEHYHSNETRIVVCAFHQPVEIVVKRFKYALGNMTI